MEYEAHNQSTSTFFGAAVLALPLLFLSTIFVVPVVYAQDVGPEPQVPGGGLVPCDGVTVPCTFDKLVEGTQVVIKWLIYAAVFFAAILFSWAGILYLSSAGDTGKVERAHRIFKNVAIGFIIALGAWLIVHTITVALLDEDGQNLPLLEG